MRYALLIHYPQPAVSTLTPEEIKAGMAAFHAYAKALNGACVAHAAAVDLAGGPAAGLKVLDAIADEAAHRFQLAWATRAHSVADAGRAEQAPQAHQRHLAHH